MSILEFGVETEWTGGISGRGQTVLGARDVPVGVPLSLGGTGQGTNPEELAVAAASTCFAITLAAILKGQRVAVDRLSVQSRGGLLVENEGRSLTLQWIQHTPRVILAADADAGARTLIAAAVLKAENACLVSRAMRGNVVVTVNLEAEGGVS